MYTEEKFVSDELIEESFEEARKITGNGSPAHSAALKQIFRNFRDATVALAEEPECPRDVRDAISGMLDFFGDFHVVGHTTDARRARYVLACVFDLDDEEGGETPARERMMGEFNGGAVAREGESEEPATSDPFKEIRAEQFTLVDGAGNAHATLRIAGVESGWWIITELHDCLAITTETGNTYFANGICSCEAYRRSTACKHRVLYRLYQIANEIEAVAVSPAENAATASQAQPRPISRESLIASIKSTWSTRFPTDNLSDNLIARFKVNRLEMLADDMLQAVHAIL